MMHETEVINTKVICWQPGLNHLNLYVIYDVMHCVLMRCLVLVLNHGPTMVL